MSIFMSIHEEAEAARRAVYDGALAGLNGEVEALRSELAKAVSDYTAATETIAVRDAMVLDLQENVFALTAQVGDLAIQIVTLNARIAELEAQTPEPPKPKTTVGASALLAPGQAAMSAASVKSVTDRWGAGTAVRLFSASGWTVAPALGDAGVLQLSWKPDLSKPIDHAAALAALVNVPAGSKVCVWHEPDVKVRKGDPVAPMLARSREFAALIRSERPDLVLMGVLSAWTFDPSQRFNAADYIDPATFDVLGIDLDGLFGYKDYLPCVANAQTWMRKVGVERWTIAEFGTKINANFTRAQRAAWLKEQSDAILALEWAPEEICLFEATVYPEYTLETEAELQAWENAIATASK